MKSNAQNNMSYAGIVTLSRHIGKNKLKAATLNNAGGAALFNFLTDCLVGNFDMAAITRPMQIMLLAEEGGYFKSCSPFFSLNSLPEKQPVTPTSGSVRYSFIIASEQLSTTFTHIGLYTAAAKDPDTDADNYAAVVFVPEAVRSTFSSLDASALAVDWDLIISNKENA